MNEHDEDQLSPAGKAPLDREGTWDAWVGFLAQFGTVRADPSTGALVDDGRGTTARVLMDAAEVYDFALGSQILSEGLPLQLTDDFFERFGNQDRGHVDYVRDGWGLAQRS